MDTLFGDCTHPTLAVPTSVGPGWYIHRVVAPSWLVFMTPEKCKNLAELLGRAESLAREKYDPKVQAMHAKHLLTNTPVNTASAALHGRGAVAHTVLALRAMGKRAVNRSLNPVVPCLQLQGEILGIVARKCKVAALHPEALLCGRLPHVSELALPRAGVTPRVGAQTPHPPKLAGDILADELLHDVSKGQVSCGQHDDVGLDVAAIPQHDAARREASQIAVREPHLAAHDQLGGTCVKVVAIAASQELHDIRRVVLAKVEAEANSLQPPVVLGVLLADLPAPLLLQLRDDLEGQGRKVQVGPLRGDALCLGFVVAAAEDGPQLGVNVGDHRRTALYHGDMGARLPEVLRDIVR
mmetsp:Transcript_91003/g.253331  ORF Transcript_91003/g.253331 Transcript_91003/m.253331 type:complete len:354 (-) Transcript_91003:1083-2144(-)